MAAVERSTSLAESDILSNLFKVGSTMSLQRVDSEAQFQDFLKKIPSTTNLVGAAFDVPEPSPRDCSAGVPRVPSLDFIRAFLNASRAPADLVQQQQQQQQLAQCGDPLAAVDVDVGLPKLEPPLAQPSAPGPAAPAQSASTGSESDPCSPTARCCAPCGLSPLGPFPALPIGPGPAALVSPASLAAALMQGAAQMQGLGPGPGLALYNMAAAAAVAQGGGPVCVASPTAMNTPRMGNSAGAGSDGAGQCANSDPHCGNQEAASKQELRRARRMLSNRESARRSRKRKQEHLQELEQQISMLEGQRAELAAQLGQMRDAVRMRDAEVMALREENERLRAMAAAAQDEAGSALKRVRRSAPPLQQ